MTVAFGDSAEMQKAIEMLGSVKDSIINAYEIKTGLSRTKLSHLMDAETWMDANKAVELGFANEIMKRSGNTEDVEAPTVSMLFLGYDRGENGQPIINEEQAKTVRLIYHLYLQGKTASGICKHLMSLGIPTPSGKTKWTQGTVMSILQNEKYKGDALLQKKFTVDFLQKKMKVNEGEVPQYYVEGSHPAIITATDFDAVQDEIARRQGLGRSYSGSSIFASKLICGDCGGFYGQKVWHSTDAYRRVIWRCNSKFKGEAKCETPTLDTEAIQQMFLAAYSQLMENREQLIQDCETMRTLVNNCTALDTEIDSLNEEIQVVAGLVSQCVKENATTEQSQDEYTKKYNRLVKRYEKATVRLKSVMEERERQMQRDRELRVFIGSIEKQPLILEAWDEGLWISLLDIATVHSNNSITFRFKNGTEITIEAYVIEHDFYSFEFDISVRKRKKQRVKALLSLK